jgi:hypothetical protein
MASLLPAARQHLTPGFGAHALEESMHALAAAIVRLKSPLHNVPSVIE